MKNDRKTILRKGWHYGLLGFAAMFVLTASSAISRFFFDGRVLAEEWPKLLPSLAIAVIGGVVGGLAFYAIFKWNRSGK